MIYSRGAKYGNKLIKEYSAKLTKELGKGYTYTNLSRMRQYYLLFEKVAAVRQYFGNLTWNHYRYLLPLNNKEEITYYITIAVSQNLSVRELYERIKNNKYERISKIGELNTLIKNLIVIKTNKEIKKVHKHLILFHYTL